MPPKTGETLKQVRERSWACFGVDTSLTAISAFCIGYDAMTGTLRGPFWGEIRWDHNDNYFHRLGAAVKAANLIYDIGKELWVRDHDDIYIAIEEPVHYGAIERNVASWMKQQCEVAGAFKGGLVNQGYPYIHEINNSQWKATLRAEGVKFLTNAKGSTAAQKRETAHKNKWVVKDWAIRAFGMPDLPDLVKSKEGPKIPRPESGFGANAQAVQPADLYDAAGICAWMCNYYDTVLAA